MSYTTDRSMTVNSIYRCVFMRRKMKSRWKEKDCLAERRQIRKR